MLELPKNFKEERNSLFSDAYTCVLNYCDKVPLAFRKVLKFYWNSDLAFFRIVLDRILHDVEYDQLVNLPVSLHILRDLIRMYFYFYFSVVYLQFEGVEYLVDPTDRAVNELFYDRGLTFLDLHFLNLVWVVELKDLRALPYLADHVFNHNAEMLHFLEQVFSPLAAVDLEGLHARVDHGDIGYNII